MKNQPILIFLICILFSGCVSKKYGRYFNNRISTVSQENKTKNNTIPEYSASAKVESGSSVLNDEIAFSKEIDKSQLNVAPIENQESKVHLSNQSTVKRKTKKAKAFDVEKSQVKKKVYPLAPTGLLFTLAGFIGVLVSAANGSLSLPFLGIFVLGSIFGFTSLKKTKRLKWKGRGFAIATVVLVYAALGILFLGLFGIIAFIRSGPQ